MTALPLGACVGVAYSHPDTQTGVDGKEKLTNKIAKATKQKIKALFSIVLENGHDAIVLSAFGCGAYRNPPEHMALLFQETIREEKYDEQMKYIVFAIIDDHNTGKAHNSEGNVKPFAVVFGGEENVLKLETLLSK